MIDAEVKAKVGEHDIKLREHDEKINDNEKNYIKMSASIDNLTDTLKTIIAVVKWAIALLAVQYVGFFFAVVLKLIK